jgi:hypothetical protein
MKPPWVYAFKSSQRATGTRHVVLEGVGEAAGALVTAPDGALLHEMRITPAIGAAQLLMRG